MANHKTSEQGPFHLILTEGIYNALRELCQFTNGDPFATCYQRAFTASRISYEFGLAWFVSSCRFKYRDFNATLNRKRMASRMAKFGPEMQKYTAQQLRHSVLTESTYYNLATDLEQYVHVVDTSHNQRVLTTAPEPETPSGSRQPDQ